MKDAALVIITALISGLVATIITIYWQNRNQLKTEKIKIFKILMAKRYYMTSQESVEAINLVPVIFDKSDNVIIAWKEFLEAVSRVKTPSNDQNLSDKYLKMLEVMGEDIGYKNLKWDNIKQFYCPIDLHNKLYEEEYLRLMQIKDISSRLDYRKEQNDL